MHQLKKTLAEFPIEELDMELFARGAQVPVNKQFKFRDKNGTPERENVMANLKILYHTAPLPDKSLSHIETWDIVEALKKKIRDQHDIRGIWYDDDRLDYHDIPEGQIKKNADCVAAICLKEDIYSDRNGYATLRVKNYGKTFNLCDGEPFWHQPTAAGRLFSGFLVKEDVVATAGHCVNQLNVTDLRIVFGFRMSTPHEMVIRFKNDYVYKGMEVMQRAYNPRGNLADWALIRLDRKVEEYSPLKLSERDIAIERPVYVIGHPIGLPLKYAPGASIQSLEETYFGAPLDIYSGNSGSPVFDRFTHEVIGIVVRGDYRDFRWTGKGWLSFRYPNPAVYSRGAQCTRVQEFFNYV